MALTINWEGKGVIANATTAESTSWLELGGGTIGANPDVYIYGSESYGNKYASKSGYSYFDIGAGNQLDFSGGGTEEGQLIYFWLNIAAGGAFDTLANKGFAIRVGTDTSNYREWIIGGEDDTNGWTGGWKLFVVDPTIAGSIADTGTFNLASVRTFGVWIDTNSSVRADSIFIDQISVGSGLRVTGTSTTAWKDVVDYCTDYINRAWGIFQEYEGVYLSYGKILIGDSAQTAITQFKDSARIIQYGESQFWHAAVNGRSTTGWDSTVKADAFGIVLDDAAGFRTEYEDGIIVGTDNGRSGCSIIGNVSQDVFFDASSLTHADSFVKLYNSQFNALRGGIKLHNDANSVFYGGVVNGCGQFDPVGAPIIRNCVFSGTTDSHGGTNIDGAALLWNANINIRDCQFIANIDATGNPHGIQHDVAGTYTYNNLTFSSNDVDILFIPTTGDLIITAQNGADPATITENTSGTTRIDNPVTLSLTGLIVGTEIRILKSGTQTAADSTDGSEGDEDVGTSTHEWNYNYPAVGYTHVDISIIKKDYEIIFLENILVEASSFSIPIQQQVDRNYIT